MVVEISQPSTVARPRLVEEEEVVVSAMLSSVESALAETLVASLTMPMVVELPAPLVHSVEEEVVCATRSRRVNVTAVIAAASPTKWRRVVIKWTQLLLLCGYNG